MAGKVNLSERVKRFVSGRQEGKDLLGTRSYLRNALALLLTSAPAKSVLRVEVSTVC